MEKNNFILYTFHPIIIETAMIKEITELKLRILNGETDDYLKKSINHRQEIIDVMNNFGLHKTGTVRFKDVKRVVINGIRYIDYSGMSNVDLIIDAAQSYKKSNFDKPLELKDKSWIDYISYVKSIDEKPISDNLRKKALSKAQKMIIE